MEQVSGVGQDLARSVFQVHGVNAQGEAVLRRRLSRSQLLKLFEKLPPCLVGIDACASAHHWARELAALGHEIKLMPPQYVKPYVKRGEILTRQRTRISNALHAHMAEFGITPAIGHGGLDRLIAVIADQDDARLPEDGRDHCE